MSGSSAAWAQLSKEESDLNPTLTLNKDELAVLAKNNEDATFQLKGYTLSGEKQSKPLYLRFSLRECDPSPVNTDVHEHICEADHHKLQPLSKFFSRENHCPVSGISDYYLVDVAGGLATLNQLEDPILSKTVSIVDQNLQVSRHWQDPYTVTDTNQSYSFYLRAKTAWGKNAYKQVTVTYGSYPCQNTEHALSYLLDMTEMQDMGSSPQNRLIAWYYKTTGTTEFPVYQDEQDTPSGKRPLFESSHACCPLMGYTIVKDIDG
jgi:hypothetical protein